jgi:nucleotidyltransferase substrate binding protein (TIGR01987 family)
MDEKMEKQDIRWVQRYNSFSKAYLLLKNSLNDEDIDKYSDLEKTGIIKRFELVFELSWKLLHDYLKYLGSNIDFNSPRSTIKQAFSVGLIVQGDEWIKMLESRNHTVHIYDNIVLDDYFGNIKRFYVVLFGNLYDLFTKLYDLFLNTKD